ncbi:MAG: tetratricopeptide repeat protein [Calothrix sp. MO_167.B42]|nr:tetratricopeptide repeat protein [Calothrix sp. MO_167.B42]
MSFQLDRGLFKYDFTDYHAILCIPVDANVKDIRKRYLKIVRRLHPDSLRQVSEDDKKLANQLLSKLVNPAYEKLSAEQDYAEYVLVLSQIGKRLQEESSSVELTSDAAKKLTTAPNVEQLYKTAIAQIASKQYDSLKDAIAKITLVSELNLVYLMRTGGKNLIKQSSPPPAPTPAPTPAPAPAPAPAQGKPSTPPPKTTPPPKAPTASNEESRAIQYIRRAQDLIAKNQFAAARVELQDALKLEPNNSTGHSLIGMVYLRQNQTTMAKVHFDRALQLDPNDEQASAGKSRIEQILGKSSPGKPKASQTGAKSTNKSEGGGLFGGLFGGKKK